jgi:phage-related protein
MSLKIHGNPNDSDIYIGTDITGWLNESEQRKLIQFFWKERPDIIQDVACKDCKEKKVQ